jgi:hypothetical protein
MERMTFQQQPASIGLKLSVNEGVFLLLRLLVAQIPALVAWLSGHPATSWMVLAGIVINAIFKFLREAYPGWIIWVPL